MNLENDINRLTNDFAKIAGGENAAAVVGASLNMIQSCMTYGDPTFQRACAESLRGMANIMLQAIGKPKQ